MKNRFFVLILSLLMSVGLLAQMEDPFQSTSTLGESGSNYSSQISTVGATNVPSSATTTEGTGTHSGRTIHKLGGMGQGDDPGQYAEGSPIGEPLAMLLFAAAAAGVIYFKRKKSTTNMKNTSNFSTLSLLCLMTIGLAFSQEAKAATSELPNGSYLYCNVTNTNWSSSGAKMRFNLFYNQRDFYKNANGTNLTGNIWYTKIDNAYVRYVQMLRMSDNWSTQWNYSNGINVSARSNDKQNCVSITGSSWDGASISWGTYVPPMKSLSIANNGTTIVSGSGTQASPYIIAAGATIKVKATAAMQLADPNPTFKYKYKVDGVEGSYGDGNNTYQFTAGTEAHTYAVTVRAYATYNSTDNTAIDASNTIYFKVPSYTISYDPASDAGQGFTYAVAPITGVYGSTVSMTINPKTGYTIAVSAKNSSTSASITLSKSSNTYSFTMPASDVAITVTPTPKTYTVTLDPNGGTGETQTVTVTYNSNTITGSITNPTAPAGYYFYGWRTGTSGGSLIIYNNQLQSNKPDYTDASGNWIKDGNATLYAQWKESTYNITVQSNNTDYGTVATASVKAGQITSVALPAASVASSAYKFVNWTATDGITITNANSADGATITATKAGTVTANFALAATYDLTLQAGTGIAAVSGGKTGQATLPFSSDISATPKTGYSFEKWTKSGEGSVSYTSGSATSANATVSVSVGSVTLTASATPINYTITYNGLEGGTHTNPANYTIETATITLTDASRDNYTFDGWYDAATGGNKVTQIALGSTGNKTLWARWYETLHSVNIVSSTGIESVSPTGETNVGNVTPVQISATVKAGYTWKNWTTDNSSKVTITDANANPTTIKATGNTNVYAHATENMTAVTVSSNNTTWGTVSPTSANVGVSTSRQITATPKPGYKFVSWTLDGGATSTSTLTNTTITIKGDGSSATGTAVATFAEDLSSNWNIQWHKDNKWTAEPMLHSAPNSKDVICIVEIESTDIDKDFAFKIQGGSNWYGWGTNGDDKYTYTQTATHDMYDNSGSDHDLHFKPTIAGTYTFKVEDINAGTKNLTVTWPIYNCVYGEFNSWSKDANKLEFNGGNEASTVVNITNISKSYEFLVLVNSEYYTNTTTITRSSAADVQFAVKGGSDGDSKFTPDVAGDYTFTYNKSTNKLTITYPDLPTASTTATEKRMFKDDELSFIESGDGTEANPYKIYTDEALTIDITALAARTNLTAKYQFGEDPATADVLTKEILNPSITKTSILVKAFYESDGVAGTAWEKTIWYQGIPTPTLHLSTSWSGHNDEEQEGSEVPENVTIYYSTNDYNGPATVTRSKDGETPVTFMNIASGDQAQATYILPDQNVQRQTFVATATANGRTFTATKAISIYRLVEIVITDEDHLMDHYYMWENGTNPLHEETAWPGNNFFSTLGNAHIFYVKYPSYTHFVLNDGKQEGAIQTVNVTVPDRSTCYTIGEKITAEGDDKGKYDVQVADECPNKLYVGDIDPVAAVQGEGVIVSPQVDIDPLLDANNLTISFNYGSTQGITCDQRGRSFMVTATAGTGTYEIQVTYSIPGAESVTKSVTIKVTSAIMIQAKYGDLGWSDHNVIYIHYWGTNINATQKMTWKDYVDKQDRVYARIPLGSDNQINFQIYAWNMDEAWHVTADVNNVTTSGCYTISYNGDNQKRSITRDGDNCWTLYYVEIDMNNGTVYRSNTVEDLTKQVSFYAPGSSAPQAKAGAVRIICNGSQTVVIDAATFDSSTVYTAKIAANGTGLTDVAYYTGDYYIRTDAAEGGWNNYKQDSHKFTYFTPYKDALYDYYWVINKKVANQGDKLNIKACIGNEYNDNLANMIESSNYTDGYGDITPDAGTGVNLRFGYNPETNYFERSILRGSTAGENNFLNIVGNNIFNDKSCEDELTEANYSAHADWSKFGDISNWVYEKNIYVKIGGEHQSAQALLKSKAFNGTTIYQLGYTLDAFGRPTGTPAQRDILHAGTTNGTYNIRIIYDFKTNRIVSAWSPVEDVTFSTGTVIDADVLFVRHENEQAAQVILSTDASEVSSLQFAYFVLEIDGSSDKTSESIYWFSVPFDCEISSIFGVEGYVTLDANGNPTAGTWGIQTYDGEARAQKGWYIQDTQTFWRWMKKDEKLLKGNGYVLVFDRSDAKSKGLWKEITREEPCEGEGDGCVDGKKTVTTTVLRLYFPSIDDKWKMTRSGKGETVTYLDWTCTKPNRKAQDSNWRLMGTNSYSNIKIDAATQFERTDNDSVLDKAPNFVYVYDRTKAAYNRYTATSSVNKDFQSFNCYMVQFSGTINWNQYTQSIPETSVAARRVVAEDELTNAQMTLSLKKGSTTEDNTFIYMDARATTDFDNQMDLTKITDTRANQLYSVINEVEYAGNTLPVEDQIVPLTVNVNANGAYTFAMPEMTEGLEVYLVDNTTDTHTDMAIGSYTVDLNKGKIAGRFYLDVRVKERTTPTIIETIDADGYPTGDRFIKVIQNDQLRIIRNGRIYNASGMELSK
ncbi:MAG: InlB B-repeat-containing protein [Paludibacteraceae bacterium]|nr:InlB B-repeat-containing protein [Paludibacteraceae bacterium]